MYVLNVIYIITIFRIFLNFLQLRNFRKMLIPTVYLPTMNWIWMKLMCMVSTMTTRSRAINLAYTTCYTIWAAID